MFPPPSVLEKESNGRRRRRITRRPIMLRVVSRVSMSDLLGKELTLPRFLVVRRRQLLVSDI